MGEQPEPACICGGEAIGPAGGLRLDIVCPKCDGPPFARLPTLVQPSGKEPA